MGSRFAPYGSPFARSVAVLHYVLDLRGVYGPNLRLVSEVLASWHL